MNGSFCNLCALAAELALHTAVHCCDPALSVLVTLVSPNVFHVILALQSIVYVHFY